MMPEVRTFLSEVQTFVTLYPDLHHYNETLMNEMYKTCTCISGHTHPVCNNVTQNSVSLCARLMATYTLHGTGAENGSRKQWVIIFYAELFTLHWNRERDRTPLSFIQIFLFPFPPVPESAQCVWATRACSQIAIAKPAQFLARIGSSPYLVVSSQWRVAWQCWSSIM